MIKKKKKIHKETEGEIGLHKQLFKVDEDGQDEVKKKWGVKKKEKEKSAGESVHGMNMAKGWGQKNGPAD